MRHTRRDPRWPSLASRLRDVWRWIGWLQQPHRRHARRRPAIEPPVLLRGTVTRRTVADRVTRALVGLGLFGGALAACWLVGPAGLRLQGSGVAGPAAVVAIPLLIGVALVARAVVDK